MMVIVGEVQYFPTMYEQPGRGFLIAARDPLLTLLNRERRMPTNPNELWLGLVEGQDVGVISQQFPDASRSIDRYTEQAAIRADPLTLGLRSVTILGTALTALLSLAGFATHFYLSARQRETAYSILRSLGLSTGQLYLTLVLEQVVMIIAGLLLGILLGWVLNQLVLPSLPLSLGDRPPVPPMIPLEDWHSILRFTLGLSGAFLVILGGATALLWRVNVHRLMRIGQD
jgi:ABC-type antimicrobial peptide transport system permease subunit